MLWVLWGTYEALSARNAATLTSEAMRGLLTSMESQTSVSKRAP